MNGCIWPNELVIIHSKIIWYFQPVKFRLRHLPLLLAFLALIVQSCGSVRWDNFNRKKHLKLKSKEVYTESEKSQEEVIPEDLSYQPKAEQTYEEAPHESMDPKNTGFVEQAPSTTLEEQSDEEDSVPLVIVQTDEQLRSEDKPSKEDQIREAKIKELRKELRKSHKWSLVVFVPMVVFLVLLAVLFFTLNLANPVGELLWIVTLFAGLTLVLGVVSSARAISYSKQLKELSEDEEDHALARKMIRRSVIMLSLYALLPALLAGGLLLFAE